MKIFVVNDDLDDDSSGDGLGGCDCDLQREILPSSRYIPEAAAISISVSVSSVAGGGSTDRV